MTLNPPKTLMEFPLGKIYGRQIEKSFPADGLDVFDWAIALPDD
jgi:hypothetical protein